jgi:hypothetical protein
MNPALIASLSLPSSAAATAVAVVGLMVCLILYLGYKLFYRPDFGMPVRRRILTRRLRIRRDQFADVPIWWSDLQVQRAISVHWKQSLRDTVTPPVGGWRPERPAVTGTPPDSEWHRAGD